MMSARLWRSSPRTTHVGSPATPSASMAVRSSEFGGSDDRGTNDICASDLGGFRLGWAGPHRALQCPAKTRKAAGRLLSAQNRKDRRYRGQRRRRWIREQGMLDPARLVFIDETAECSSLTSALPASSRRPATTTFAPFLAKATAAARPMPVKAPVIKTTGLLIWNPRNLLPTGGAWIATPGS